MVSSNEADFDLRESFPLSRNILHACERNAYGSTGQRTSREVVHCPTDYRGWLGHHTSQKVPTGNLNYPVSVRDSAKSGTGHKDNRHLNYLVESISVNVGGSDQNVKASSLPMSGLSVGGVIVVGARESRVQGEGHQFVGIPMQISRMVTRRNLR
jgi:hypothetical protein